MTPEELKSHIRVYAPAFLVDRFIGSRKRHLLRNTLGIIAALIIVVLFFGTQNEKLEGALFIALAVWLLFWFLDFFYNSYFFKQIDESTISFNAARTLAESAGGDIVSIFLLSPQGRWIALRSGIDTDVVHTWVGKRTTKVTLANITLTPGKDSGRFTLKELVQALFEVDSEFAQFIVQSGVDKNDFIHAADWLEWRERNIARRMQWWGRDELAKVPGIAKDWAYGKTFYLDKYSRDLIVEAQNTDVSTNGSYKMDEVKALEGILSRNRDANAVLVGEQGAGAMDIIYLLAKKIYEGTVYPELEHKRMLMLDTTSLIASTKEKDLFENEIIRIFNETVQAGNIILVIDNLPEFIENSKVLGSDAVALLDPYLGASALQVIALSTPRAYHDVVQTNSALSQRFEKVLVKDADQNTLMRFLENEIERHEAKYKLFFLFPAIRTIALSAERYFGDNPSLDKAGDLLEEIIPQAKAAGRHVITKNDVLELVEKKTGIPLGEVEGAEREKLLNLEKTLHQRIIGQTEAVSAISNAMRRARSGVGNPNRPIGSFLFLGPTGVGKTETTKALAHAFFNSENQIMRLDMSEYKTDDALKRLIGSFDDGRTGVLSTMLRDKQFGVLLLDEFEKTNREILDLFLQVLDEGFFSDMNGKKVNVRNTIVIATSNAGSNLIWEALKAGENLEDKKSFIIDQIIAQGIFKPELLNRFDGVILFHPLSKEDLTKIAELMLKKLNKRLEEKGISLAITPELIEYLVNTGIDPKFGARAMNRAIQEKVEQIIAERIIKGEAMAGSRITLTKAELEA